VQCWTPDDGQGNCPKHVEFHSKNRFRKLVHLIGFVIRIYHDARSSECHTCSALSVLTSDNKERPSYEFNPVNVYREITAVYFENIRKL